MIKTCIITGASSGIGRATAIKMLSEGYKVYDLSRHDASTAGIKHIDCDVTDDESVKAAIANVVSEEGNIDILINSAGIAVSGAVEFTAEDTASRQFDVNFWGMVRMNNAVIPVMRKQNSGKILNISSVAAQYSLPFQAYYSASKAAINSYSMAVANELRPFGVQMCAIQPGDIASNITASRNKSIMGDDVYNGRISKNLSRIEKDETTGQTPESAARAIAKIAAKKTLKPIYTISFSYKLLCFIGRFLPGKAINKILYSMYAK